MPSLSLLFAASYPQVPSLVGNCTGNFSNEWISINGEYISIVEHNCMVTATNPVESWSPANGIVEGNMLHMFNIQGTLVGRSIHWNDGPRTVWTVVDTPPLNEGLQNVRKMLQIAIETEHSTIQPYLSALYSIKAGTNLNATSVLHGVAVEEMLHMTSAANILNAVGGHPSINTKSFVPVYPMMLPYVELPVSLAPFTQAQTELFRHIEEATWGPDSHDGKHTVGVWYFEIGLLLDQLVKRYGEEAVFVGDPALQINASSSRGKVEGVYNHADAKRMITMVSQEGEGIKGALYDLSPFSGESECPHFYRFNEVVHNRYYQTSDNTSHGPSGATLDNNWGAVYNFVPNPKAANYSKYPEIHQKMLVFNSCYTRLLAGLHDVFNGSPGSFMEQVGSMYVLATLAKELMVIPAPERPGMTVGAPWEWLDITGPDATACPALQTSTTLYA